MTLNRISNMNYLDSEGHNSVPEYSQISYSATSPMFSLAAGCKPEITTTSEHSHCKRCGDDLTNHEKDRGYCGDCWSKMG